VGAGGGGGVREEVVEEEEEEEGGPGDEGEDEAGQGRCFGRGRRVLPACIGLPALSVSAALSLPLMISV